MAQLNSLVVTGNSRFISSTIMADTTMTGQLKTSFKEAIAVGSYSLTNSSTLENVCEDLRYSSGAMGSFSLGTVYTKDGITIATGWYNYLWIPHRTGGVNGAASGDNCDYGSLYLSGMTVSGCYMVRYSNRAIAELKNLYADTKYNFSGSTFTSGSNGVAEHNANNVANNGLYYYQSNGPSTDIGATTTDGALFVQAHSSPWMTEIAQDYRDGDLFVRGKNNSTWTQWKKILCFEDAFGLYYTTGVFKFDPITRKIMTIKSTSAWDAQVYSAQGYSNNCIVTFKAGSTGHAIMMGLDDNPSQDVGYNNIDYCFYLYNTNDKTIGIYEKGTNIGNFGTYVVGTEFSIEYSGGYIRYFVDGVQKRSVARAISGKLYVDSSFHGASGIVYDFDFRQSLNSVGYAVSAGSASSATTASQLGSSTVGGTTTPIYLNAGTPTALSYTIATSVPSGAVFTDAKVTQTPVNTNAAYEVLFSGTADNSVHTEGAGKYSNLLFNPSTSVLYGPNEMRARDLSVSASNGTQGGISLYSSSSNMDNYGIYFRQTSNKGKHGYVQSDWATYFTMSNTDNRGWIFRRNSSGNVASINTAGNAAFNGSVTIGANEANTSGARMVYDSTSKAINFEFV